MPAPTEDVKGLLQLLWSRLARVFTGAPPQTLALTGVLGLAAFLYGLYQFRRAGKRRPPPPHAPSRPASALAATLQNQQQSQPGSSSSHQRHDAQLQPAPHQRVQPSQDQVSQPAPAASAAGAEGSLAAAVQAQLAGVSVITISAPGVLLQETEPHQLQDGATVQDRAAEVVRAMSHVAKVFVLVPVEDEIGEATVRCALDGANLLGPQPGQIKPHRLLFCSTLVGKVSMVRQLEPGLHVDAAAATIDGLRRFMPQLLYIRHPQGAVPASASNVGVAGSLAEVFQA